MKITFKFNTWDHKGWEFISDRFIGFVHINICTTTQSTSPINEINKFRKRYFKRYS